MGKAKKSIIILVFVLIAAIFVGTTVTLAYFSAESSKLNLNQLTLVEDSDNKGTVTVNSVYDLKVWARDQYYNVSSPVSSSGARYVLQLGADIVLDENLLIDRDAAIILNGHKLDLQDFTITVRHSYQSRQLIANERYFAGDAVGTVAATDALGEGLGKIVYDTPNAVVVIDSSVADVAAAGKIEVQAFDAARAILLVREYISSVVKEGYNYVSDIELPLHYGSYPYAIVWDSSAPNLVENSGKVDASQVTDASGSASVVLSYKILDAAGDTVFDSADEETVEGAQKNNNITVNILAPNAAEKRFEIGKAFLDDYFAKYKNSAGDYYNLFLNISLPSVFKYYGLTFNYRTVGRNQQTGAWDTDEYSTRTDIKGGGEGDYDVGSGFVSDPGKANGLYLYWPEKAREYRLEVKMIFTKSDTEEESRGVAASYVFVAIDGNNSNYSQAVLEKISVIVIDAEEDTVVEILSDEDKRNFNVQSVAYSFVDQNGNPVATDYYRITEDVVTAEVDGVSTSYIADRLHVNKLPSTEETIYLKMVLTFEMGRPKEITVTAQVFYVDASQSGGAAGTDPFAVYHQMMLKEYRDLTNYGQTYKNFAMPGKVGNKVYVRYYLSATDSSQNTGNTITGFGGRLTIDYSAEEMPIFIINHDIPEVDSNLTLSFYVKYSTSVPPDGDWSGVPFYGLKATETGELVGTPVTVELKILGLLRKGKDVTAGNYLYEVLLEKYDRDKDGYLTLDEIAAMSSTSLTIEKNYIDSSNKTRTFSDFKGIEFLTPLTALTIKMSGFGANAVDLESLLKLANLTELRIAESELTAADTTLFGALSNLTQLELSNCDLGDQTIGTDTVSFDFSGNIKLKRLSLINCNLTHLDGIQSLTSLTTLQVSNESEVTTNKNKIKKFRVLLDLEKLTYVSLYGNSVGSDGRYGSDGSYNSSTFILLAERLKRVSGELYLHSATEKFVASTAEIEAAYAVEGLFYAETAKISGGKIQIDLPTRLYLTAGVEKYTLTWIANGTAVLDNSKGTASVTLEDVSENDVLEFVVSVTVTDGAGENAVTKTVTRVIEIKAVA